MKRSKVFVFALALALVVFGVAPAMAEWVMPGAIGGLTNDIVKARPVSSTEMPGIWALKETAVSVRNVLQEVSDKVFIRSDVIDRIAGSSSAPRQRIPVFNMVLWSPDVDPQVYADKSFLVMYPLASSTFAGKKASDLKVVKVYGDAANDFRLYSPVYTGGTLADGKFAVLNSNGTTFLGESETIQSGYNYYVAFCLKNGGNYDLGRKYMPYQIHIIDPVFIYTSVVVVPVAGITVSPTQKVIAPNTTFALTAAVAPANADNQNVNWTSSNTSVATVSATGVVTGVTFGTALITATTVEGGFSASSTITVGVPVTGVTVDPATHSMGVGATVTLTETIVPATATNKAVTWSSSNTAVATVSSTGVVTGVSAGTATITVTTADGAKTATSTITVVSGPQPVTPGFQLPSGVENPSLIVVPSTVGESGLNSGAANTVGQVSVSSMAASGTYLVLTDSVVSNNLSYRGNSMNSQVAIKMPVFKATVSASGKTGVVMFQLPASSLIGFKAGHVAPVKAISTSASQSLSYVFVDAASKLADGKFGIVRSDKTTFMGAEDLFVSGSTYYIVFAIKDGGPFDMNTAGMVITDPTFVGISTGRSSGGGGCATGTAAPAALLILLPLLALFRKRG